MGYKEVLHRFEKSNDFSGFGKVDEKDLIAKRASKNISENQLFFFVKFIQITFFS